jgi:hypothetical protein
VEVVVQIRRQAAQELAADLQKLNLASIMEMY